MESDSKRETKSKKIHTKIETIGIKVTKAKAKVAESPKLKIQDISVKGNVISPKLSQLLVKTLKMSSKQTEKNFLGEILCEFRGCRKGLSRDDRLLCEVVCS